MLEDEIELLQYGEEEEFEFYRVNFESSAPSFMDKWPTEEQPDNKYKFGSLWIELSQNEIKIERQTYSFLEWLGEIGGLFEMARVFGFLVVAPLASYRLRSELLTKIFRFIPSYSANGEQASDKASVKSDNSYQDNQRLEDHINWDFSQPRLIQKKGYCTG